MTKILIVGLGGVGGYYGGLLAKKYIYDTDIQICFLARGNNLKTIKEVGLTIKTDTGTFLAQPSLITDNVDKIGVADYIILATKAYDLESTIEQIKPCIGKSTVVLPVLNGIDNTDRIKAILPNTEVWYGCTYVVSKLEKPGLIVVSGNAAKLVYGTTSKNTEKLLAFDKIIKDAGINSEIPESIHQSIWTKFFNMSPSSTAATYFDCTFGELQSIEKYKKVYDDLFQEFIAVAKAENIQLDETVVENTTKAFAKLPSKASSSMRADFKSGKQNTELETITGVIVRLAEKNGIEVPVYKNLYEALKEKLNKTV